MPKWHSKESADTLEVQRNHRTSTRTDGTALVGKRLPPPQSHAFEWVRDWVRVLTALHHTIDKVEKPSLDGIRHHDTETTPITYQSSSHLFPSSLFCFIVLANQLSHYGYSLSTLLKTKRPLFVDSYRSCSAIS
jgi:hypothetical protein